MSGLGARISVLLTLAILFIVGVATFLAMPLLGPGPGPGRPDGPMMDGPRPPGPMFGRRSGELAFLVRAAEMLSAAERAEISRHGAISIGDDPPEGRTLEPLSRELARELQRKGLTSEARVVESAEGGPLRVAARLSDGKWLTMEAAPPPPNRGDWTVFAFWMALIAAGTAGVVAFAVIRALRPLAVLEREVAAIGPDGEFAQLPETGPPEVRAATRAINLLSSRLKQAMESRMRLVAAAGHDLRTPLTRMRLRAEFLTDEQDRDRWLADLEELDSIADSAIRLVREEVDPDARQPTRIDCMVREIVDDLAEIKLPIAVTRTTPAEALVRPLAMKRALRNLALNAATHGVTAQASVEISRGSVVVAIEDVGPGIPPDLLDRAFEPFFRVDPARHAPTPGAGLGLAIAKEIVGRNGGSLSIANRPGSGLVQVVTLPLAPNEPA